MHGICEYDRYQMKPPDCTTSTQNSQDTEKEAMVNMIDKGSEDIYMSGTCTVFNGQIDFRKIIRESLQKEIRYAIKLKHIEFKNISPIKNGTIGEMVCINIESSPLGSATNECYT